MTAKQLLDRETINQFVQTQLAQPISLLRELVDYGVVLLEKYGQQGGSLTDLVINGHFFGQTVEG